MRVATDVVGLGAWMPGCPGVEAVIDLMAHKRSLAPDNPMPACTDVPSRLKRGTSLVTRMANEVASEVLSRSGLEAANVSFVFGSSYGESQIAIEQLEMMVTGDGKLSPARFKNSVHNTAAGIFSIAHQNRGQATALAAGDLTTAYALLEGQLIVAERHAPAIVVVADEHRPPPLDRFGTYRPCAVAFALTSVGSGHGSTVRLGPVQPESAPPPRALGTDLDTNPCAPALMLMRALHQREAGLHSLGRQGHGAWSVEVIVEASLGAQSHG